jgi:prepilin-type N-terminal cleavage/methylation domain-containing protein
MEMLKSKTGMTLVEVMVAFAMIAIVSLVVVFGFHTMSGVSLKGSKINNADQEMESVIAQDAGSYATEAAITGIEFTVDGNSFKIPGNVRIYADDERTFRVFVPEDE